MTETELLLAMLKAAELTVAFLIKTHGETAIPFAALQDVSLDALQIRYDENGDATFSYEAGAEVQA